MAFLPRKYTMLNQTYIVATAAEMREIVNMDECQQIPVEDLFDVIKFSGSGAFSGDWGDELIYWDFENPAVVICEPQRLNEIKIWINDCLFGDHNQ